MSIGRKTRMDDVNYKAKGFGLHAPTGISALGCSSVRSGKTGYHTASDSDEKE